MGSEYQGTSIGSGVQSQTSINAEWQLLETALGRLLNVYGDNTVGTNAMQVDFDMNSNDILNGARADFTSLYINGVEITTGAVSTLPTLTSDDPGKLIVVNDTYDGYDIATHVHIEHTATEGNDHVLDIECDTAGFADVKAIQVDYTTGALAAGDGQAINQINIDQALSVGGHIYAYNVSATSSGGAHTHALRAGATVNPIQQDSGTFANPTTGTNDTQSTDVAAMIDGSIGTTTSIFVADDDYIIIGAAAAFGQIEFILTTIASGPGIKPTFWYSTSGTHQFTQFYPVDGTNGFKNTGIVSWDSADFTGHVADGVTGTFDIRINRTQNTLTTTPILGYAKAAAVVEYTWDESGNLDVASVNVNVGGSASAPSLSFGDGNTGFYESGDNTLVLTVGGALHTQYIAGVTQSQSAGAWRLAHLQASSTAPTLIPERSDANTGIGWNSADNLSLVAGGLEAIRAEDPADLGAGETSLWVFDDDNNGMEQVTIGAADSGGSGYKLLRILN